MEQNRLTKNFKRFFSPAIFLPFFCFRPKNKKVVKKYLKNPFIKPCCSLHAKKLKVLDKKLRNASTIVKAQLPNSRVYNWLLEATGENLTS